MNAHTTILDDVPRHTPWGYADHVVPIARGIAYVNTPSHGGFWLEHQRLVQVPIDQRMARWGRTRTPLSPWFEHDCDWCFAVLAHEDAFNSETFAEAQRMFAKWGEARVKEFAA